MALVISIIIAQTELSDLTDFKTIKYVFIINARSLLHQQEIDYVFTLKKACLIKGCNLSFMKS